MLRVIVLAVLAIVLHSAAAQALPEISAEVTLHSRWKDQVSDGTMKDGYYPFDPALADLSRSINVHFPGFQQESWSRSSARARLPGTVGSRSSIVAIGNQLNEVQKDVESRANARYVAHMLVGASDPAQTEATLDLAVQIDGFLSNINHCCPGSIGTGNLVSSVSSFIDIHTDDGVVRRAFEARATLDNRDLAADPIWAEDFVETSRDGLSARYDIDYFEVLDDVLTVPVGTVFAMEFSLETFARAVDTVELWAEADFLNTGSFEFIAPPGITLTMLSLPAPISEISEPVSAALAMAGLFGLAAPLGSRSRRLGRRRFPAAAC